MQVHSLYRYPVKSCRSLDVPVVQVERRGFATDRRWVVVDALADNRALTQRTQPRLALIQPIITDDHTLILRSDGQTDLELPADASRPETQISVWYDRIAAYDLGDVAANWLQTVLGDTAIAPRLCYQGDAHFRPSDYSNGGDPLSFADGSPVLLTNAESLATVNGEKSTPIMMDRFRPNLVIAGAPAFAEDIWDTIQIGPIVFSVVNACDRCKIVTLDQQTGIADTQDDNTLKALLAANRRGATGKIHFGMDLIPQNERRLHVGDAVTVLAMRDTPRHLSPPL